MTDTDIDERNKTRRASLAKARQVRANNIATRAERLQRREEQIARAAASPPVTSEFEGLTATECCDECVRNLNAARGAQKRINEFEVLYKRQPSRVLGNETVMEGDAEWLSRNFDARPANLIEGDPGQPERPELKAEWKKLTAAVGGLCIISGKSYCASPTKGGLHSAEKNDYEALKRFKRAKEMLMDAKLDLQKMSQ
jgi:hypothetical protein